MRTHIDLAFRPFTYFPESPTREELLSRIKGQIRREQVRARLDGAGIGALTPFLARDNLNDSERKGWGAIHPENMGGEYLPDLEDNEVEIARVSLKSLTADQISIRARAVGKCIHYRVEDEYETCYNLPFAYSYKPLTLKKLIYLINHVDDGYLVGGLVIGFWEQEVDWGRDKAEAFVSIDSAYYPDLGSYYTAYAEQWFRRRLDSKPRVPGLPEDTEWVSHSLLTSADDPAYAQLMMTSSLRLPPLSTTPTVSPGDDTTKGDKRDG